MDARAGLVIAVGIAAVVEDVSNRRISNWTSGGAFAAGLILHGSQRGFSGLGQAALGGVIGFMVFLLFYLLGGMGGGDIKLMAGFGSLLGSGEIFVAALMTALCGGVMALGYLAVSWVRRRIARKAASCISAASGGGQKMADSIPYAPAITAGAWLALVGS